MVGTWESTAPDGTKSVRTNRPKLQGNTTYIENNMKLDHFWNEDTNKDGYHKQAHMVNRSADPTSLATGTNGMYYVREKSANEAPGGQYTEPFFYQQIGGNNLYSQIGFRCLVHWIGGASTPVQGDVLYYHNLNLQSAGTPGVVRNSEGIYTLTFANALPSANYIVFGSAMRLNNTNRLYVAVSSEATKATAMKTTSVKISFQYEGNTLRDPDVAMVAIVGG